MTKEEEEETGTASGAGEWKNQDPDDIWMSMTYLRKWQQLTDADVCPVLGTLLSHLQTSPLNVNQPVIPNPNLHYTQSPRPRLSCFSIYLLFFFDNMFQAGNHEFRSQGTESEPCAPGLQGGDDLGQIVTDEAKSGIFSKFLNHWQEKRKPPHIHSQSSKDPDVLNFSMVTWRVQETSTTIHECRQVGMLLSWEWVSLGWSGLEISHFPKLTSVSPQYFIKCFLFYDLPWFWCSCHPIPLGYEIQYSCSFA